MIALVSRWQLRDGCPDELGRALDSLRREVEQSEPGTLVFSVGTPGDWPPVGPPPDYEVVELGPPSAPATVQELVFIEVYADACAFAAHLRGSFRAFLDRHRHHFATPWQGHPRPAVTWIDPRWVMARLEHH